MLRPWLIPFIKLWIFIDNREKRAISLTFAKVQSINISMRPTCPVCGQRACAVNYVREDVHHYRSRCENCIRKGRQLRARVPRWKQAGYTKKNRCDSCGFRAQYSAQILVCHIDGDLDNTDQKNLRSICRNCEVKLSRDDLPWKAGDLEADN